MTRNSFLHLLDCLRIAVLLISFIALAFAGIRFLVSKGVAEYRKPGLKVLHDTVTVYVPGPTMVKEVLVPVPADVDTAAILEAYFSKRVFTNDVKVDNHLNIAITDTVFQNRIIGRRVTTDLKLPKPKLHEIGVSALVSPHSYTLAMDYRYKRWTLMAGYDFYNRAPMIGARFNLLAW